MANTLMRYVSGVFEWVSEGHYYLFLVLFFLRLNAGEIYSLKELFGSLLYTSFDQFVKFLHMKGMFQPCSVNADNNHCVSLKTQESQSSFPWPHTARGARVE